MLREPSVGLPAPAGKQLKMITPSHDHDQQQTPGEQLELKLPLPHASKASFKKQIF